MPTSEDPPREGANTEPSHNPASITPGAGDNAPTFPAEAESLLRHLNLGPTRPAADRAPEGIPDIPGYEIEAEVGSGGMGVVYRAKQIGLNRTVAIKMILASAYATPGEVARFRAEAEAIAAVKHANVIEVYDTGEARPAEGAGGVARPYFVMEFVAGGSLAAFLEKHHPLAPGAAAGLIEATARGVQAAHDASIVHRDLKPANILLAGKCETSNPKSERLRGSTPSDFGLRVSDFQPKVGDFGLAKRLASDLTRSQAVMGTPAYMAPEQAGGKAKFVGPAADVYALGVILYECLTGRVPFESGDPWSLIRQVMEDAPESPRERMPAVPRDLELICLKCLEKEPQHRYPAAAALADDLRRFLNREPVSVRPVGALRRAGRWARKRPAPVALAALVLLLLLVVPPLVVWEQGRLKNRDVATAAAEENARIEKIARDEAEKGQKTAEQLAAARELFALQNRFRTLAADRDPGWTRAARADLPRAVDLAGADAKTRYELRSAAADALLSPDLFPLESVLKGRTASAAATCPRTGLVALGEFHAWAQVATGEVWLVDPATGAVRDTLTFPPGVVRWPTGEVRATFDSVRSLAFSADGKSLYAGTRSSMVLRFDLTKPGKGPVAKWPVANNAVEQLAVSPDGKTVYALCRPDCPVRAWNVATGKPLKPLASEDGSPFHSFAVLKSGDVVAGHGHRLCRWDAKHRPVRSAETGVGMRITPTGSTMLLLANGDNLHIYNRDNLDPTDHYVDPNLRRVTHEEFVKTAVLHPSRAYAATAAGDRDRSVKVWELSSGRLVGAVAVPGTGPIAVAWSGDGRYLLATADKFVSRWEFAAAEAQGFACFSAQGLQSTTLLPDGRVAALGEMWNRTRELLVGAAGAPAEPLPVPDAGGPGRDGLCADSTGRLAVTLDAPGLQLWKPGEPFPPPGFTTKGARCAKFGPDGRVWAVVDSHEVHAYDPRTQKLLGKWSNAGERILSGLPMLDALAVGRGVVAAGGANGSVYVLDSVCVLDSATVELIHTFSNSGDPVLAVAVAPGDAFIVAGTQNGQVRVMNPATKTELQPAMAHTGGTTAVAVNRDGTLLATGGRDRAVRLWKRSGDAFEPLLTVSDMPGAPRELHFGPNDGRLMVLLAHAHAICVWDLDRLNKQLAELKLDW